MIGEIIVWIIGVVGLILFLSGSYATRLNERQIKDSQKKLSQAKPWDITDTWEKQQEGAEEANVRAVVGMFIGGFMMLVPIILLLNKCGLLD